MVRGDDGDGEEARCRLPLTVTTDLWYAVCTPSHLASTLCQSFYNLKPCYASLAKKKSVEKPSSTDLGVDLIPVLGNVNISQPPQRVGGGKVGSAGETATDRHHRCLKGYPIFRRLRPSYPPYPHINNKPYFSLLGYPEPIPASRGSTLRALGWKGRYEKCPTPYSYTSRRVFSNS